MAITIDDFNKIWASTSPLTPYSFNETNYKEGWNFIGSTPPARQMWDSIQKQNDEKAQYLYNNKVDSDYVQEQLTTYSEGTLTAINGELVSAGSTLRKIGSFVECNVSLINITGITTNTWNNLAQIPNGFLPLSQVDFLAVDNGRAVGIQAQTSANGIIRVWVTQSLTSVRLHVVYLTNG